MLCSSAKQERHLDMKVWLNRHGEQLKYCQESTVLPSPVESLLSYKVYTQQWNAYSYKMFHARAVF